MELARITKYNANLVLGDSLFSFEYTGDTPREVLVRVNLGDDSKPIAGGGNYVLKPYINGVLLSPVATVPVQGGVTKTILHSRVFQLEPGDVLTLSVIGLAGDTAVNAVSSVRDATPIRASELVGDGAVPVDHNYGGTDAYTVIVSDGRRVDNATVLAFRSSDYAAGRRETQYAVARTSTDVNGQWTSALMLDPGDYVLFVYKQGVIQAKAVDLTVS